MNVAQFMLKIFFSFLLMLDHFCFHFSEFYLWPWKTKNNFREIAIYFQEENKLRCCSGCDIKNYVKRKLFQKQKLRIYNFPQLRLWKYFFIFPGNVSYRTKTSFRRELVSHKNSTSLQFCWIAEVILLQFIKRTCNFLELTFISTSPLARKSQLFAIKM